MIGEKITSHNIGAARADQYMENAKFFDSEIERLTELEAMGTISPKQKQTLLELRSRKQTTLK